MEVYYKGYFAKIFFSPEAGTFCGEILNSPEVIAFLASDFNEALELLYRTIDNYLRLRDET